MKITNDSNYERMKYIDVKLKFMCNVINKNNIKMKYISTDTEIVDIFTKEDVYSYSSKPKTKLQEHDII